MRCLRKSTTWRASASAFVAWLACVTVASGATPAQPVAAGPGCGRADVAPVVAAAVNARVADRNALDVSVLACEIGSQVEIDAALPEPGARLGRPARFRLMNRDRQVGYAVAIATGPVAQVQASRPIAMGAVLGVEDLLLVTAEATGVLMEPLPAIQALVGTRAVRALAAREVVTARVARIPPAVRSGDRVVIRATLGGVEITGVATAQQTGGIGDVIRLVNQDSRRALRGRITGKGEVEVVHGS